MHIQERRIDKLYGMAASMSADLIRSMPKHVFEESEAVQQSTDSERDAHIESHGQGKI